MIQSKDTMTPNNPDIIYPCPFSKGYGVPIGQAWLLLKVYYIYRFIQSGSFFLLFYFRYGPSFLGSQDSNLYLSTSLAYLVFTIWLGFCIFLRWLGYSLLAQLLIFTDIITLTFLMHASGGIGSGLGILIAVSIAAGGLLIGGRCAVVLAAIASICILSTELYTSHIGTGHQANFTYTGMLGASYFAIALLSMIMARRSEQMLTLTGQQQQTIIQLEELNQYIIQHMQSGLIISDDKQAVIMTNQAVLRLTQKDNQPTSLRDFSGQLAEAFQHWLTTPGQNVVMLQLTQDTEIQCRFMLMPTQKQLYYLTIIEDTAFYNQRLQQSKLASLGRLTASIAHEIRNPLGAISHAGQLLSESPQLKPLDQRLIKIIQTNSGRVNQIIEDILNLSRRTDSVRQKIEVHQWLTDYLDTFAIEYPEANSAFNMNEVETNLSGFIDPGHLKQIMDNLCQNALRYGKPESGKIIIKTQHSDYGPCIEIIDNGEGISAKNLKQLFEPFFTTSPSGTGLGLYISKELAELNQAKLSYYLTETNHSCFRLCLQDANHSTIEI